MNPGDSGRHNIPTILRSGRTPEADKQCRGCDTIIKFDPSNPHALFCTLGCHYRFKLMKDRKRAQKNRAAMAMRGR